MISYLASYTSGAVAVSHDQVQCSTSLTPVAVHTAAAVMKNLLTQVSTLLGLFFKQQVAKLKKIYIIISVIYSMLHDYRKGRLGMVCTIFILC